MGVYSLITLPVCLFPYHTLNLFFISFVIGLKGLIESRKVEKKKVSTRLNKIFKQILLPVFIWVEYLKMG